MGNLIKALLLVGIIGLAAPAFAGDAKSVQDFVGSDGRFDLEKIRQSGYQGPIDLKGVQVGVDPQTGEPIAGPSDSKSPADNPDDIYWDNRYLHQSPASMQTPRPYQYTTTS